MTGKMSIEEYFDGRNAALWTAWLAGGMARSEFLRRLRESRADETEIADAELAAAYDFAFAEIASETVALSAATLVCATDAGVGAAGKTDPACALVGDAADESHVCGARIVDSENVRERARRFMSGGVGSGFAYESLAVPVATGVAVGALTLIGITSNLSYVSWGACACGALYGVYYAAKAFCETGSGCRIGMIRY
jgi:hypothetical protein